MKNRILYILFIVVFIATTNSGYGQTQPQDTTKLKYNFNSLQDGSIFLKNPSEVKVIYDKVLNKFVFYEKVGDYYIKRPVFMSPEEYKKYRLKRDMLDYFKEKVSAADGKKKGSSDAQKNLLPKYYVNSKFFESIFGGNTVEFIPSGNVSIKLGAVYQNTEDPRLTQSQRSSFTFDFDQQITASILAKIGKRLKVTANYDTQTTFDFQNVIKLEYEPTEDDIIRKIDAGNINMPIKNSLINGAQSLFGVKTELQFGRTTVTAVLSQQNSESKVITSQAGATTQPFDLRATDYDSDRHFFLSQYFRENYKKSLQNYPLISSPVNITRVEVWVTNRNSSTEDFRSIVAFADLGETATNNLVKQNLTTIPANIATSNGANLPATNVNELYSRFIDGVVTGGIRDVSSVSGALSTINLSQGTDYSLLQNARKLQPQEYTLHPQLGFISLNRRLDDGEVLAVAYEYTVVGASNGETTFKVGEFSNDGIQAPANLAVKLLRSEIVTTKRTVSGVEQAFPTWRLMMKNIYALGAYPLNPDGFRFEVLYRDDQTGIPQNTLQNAQTTGIQDKTLLNLLNLDKIDQSQYAVPNGDGFFDYVEGITVNSQNGYVIFPEPEPFGEDLDLVLTNPADKTKYVFKELYLNTQINAENNFQDKNKFFLKGYFKSENSGGIPLNSYNVPRGSVKVTAGGRQLVEGVDFVVDYIQGKVQIIDPGLQASGTPIQVSTENNAIFNQQRKTFMGVDVEHRFSEDFVLGATILNVNERPITPKVNFGQEPINNTMFGVNVNYSTEVPFFTKLANKLPFVDTEAKSNLSVKADMAYMLPGTPSGIDVTGAATSYIDDFEASQIPIDLLSPLNWFTASTPDTPTFPFFNGDKVDDLSYNDKRAKLAWYAVDQIFYGLGSTPSNINAEELSRDEVRQIGYAELFPNTELDVTQNTLVRTLDLAYFPAERGTYNLNTSGTDIAADGSFIKPQENWGGIMRPLTTNNFDQANVEYIQFWIKDPYDNYSIKPEEGLNVDPNNPNNQVGDLYFNLGNLSEDILKDNRKQYENGLPADGTNLNTTETNLSRVSNNPSILYAFDENDAARTNQDVGFDGVKNENESAFYAAKGVDVSKLNPDDIASDNFQFFRGSALDAANASIINRYKNYNNTEGNSPTLNQSPESYPTAATTYPDVEDINKDQTMNTVESYYEYRVSMNRDSLKVNGGGRYVVDEKTTTITLEDGTTRQTKWYQFRVPVRSGKVINSISDFNSIRFMRMYLTNFKMPVVLRFGQLELVRGDWRRYVKTLDPAINPPTDLDPNELNKFEVGVVNLEQNDERYVLPPGIVREQLQGSTTVQQQNEQSVSVKVTDLPQNKIRAIYKNISVDLRMFKQLKMFIHAEPIGLAGTIANDDLVAIVRLGTDLNDNFYQLEIPLKISPNGSLAPLDVWPEANNLDATLEEFGKLKLKRDVEKAPLNELYPETIANPTGLVIRVKGNPTLATIRTLMLGVKNVSSTPKSAEIWFNELRSAGFENKGGWAAVISADANFADVANVSVSGRMQTIGFGNVEDRVNQRSLEETKQYDIATSVQLHKIATPQEWGLQIPMSFSYGEEFRDPKFDPQYQDVKFEDAKDQNPNSKNAQDYTRRKSISFINVKKNRNPKSKKKPKFYDVENVSVSYAFNEEYHQDYNIEKYVNQNVTASASYNFTTQPKFIEPLKKVKFLKGRYWQWLRDVNFNPIPKTFGVNSRINRNFNEQQSRNLIDIPGLSAQPKLTQRRFLFDWDYTVGLDVTKSLSVNFNATNSHIYDTFGNGEELEIFDKFFTVGRPDHYSQKLNATYKLPLAKLPFLSFMTADIGYTADYDWQAASQSLLKDTNGNDISYVNLVGNNVQNANTKNINGNINFSKFYKKIGLDKLLLPKRKGAGKGAPKLGLPTPSINNNRKIKTKTFGQKLAKGVYDVITSVKTAKISYSENNGTFLPGYANSTGFLGRNNGGPTLGFVFGSQVDIRNVALEKGWLIPSRNASSEYYNKTYSRTHYNKLDLNISVKPVKDLNITLRANRIKTRDLSQQLDIVDNELVDTPVFETGNFSMSYYMLPTMFSNSDELFQTFRANRNTIAQRLVTTTRPDANKFGAQEVLIPAFLATYSGSSAETTGLKPFKNIPIPNWTLRYNGFMKYKWFKKNFSSFTLTHGYKSSYSVSSFTNNSQFEADKANLNTAGFYEPELLISSVSLIDEFSPLMRIDMKMKNSFSFKGEIKKDRALTLNLNNSTLTDVKGTEFILGFGYRIKDVKMKTKITGRKQTLKGDINLQADISLRDNITVIRSVDEDNNQITGGQKLFSFKLQADYRLNSNLTASFYYNHNTSRYAISTTFPRQSINAGFNIIYNLGN